MPYSFVAFLSRACLGSVVGLALSAVPIAQGPVPYASCKFNRFLLDPSKPMDPSIGWGIGANDWGTTVGQAVKLVQGPIDTQGFIRYSGGAVSYYTLSGRSEEHTSELQSQSNLVCRLLLEKKKEDSRITAVTLRDRTLRT